MVEAPARSKLPLGSGGAVVADRGDQVAQRQPRRAADGVGGVRSGCRRSAAAGMPVPLGERREARALATGTTWLLVMSTGMSRIDVSLLRSQCGQRSVMSNSLFAFDHGVRALPPTALWMTLLTSATLTPHGALVLIDAELQVGLAHDAEDADVLDAVDLLQDGS